MARPVASPGVTAVTDQSDPGASMAPVHRARERARDFVRSEMRTSPAWERGGKRRAKWDFNGILMGFNGIL